MSDRPPHSRVIMPALLAACLAAVPLWADQPADLRLVPFPKEVRLQEGVFDLNRPLTLSAPRHAGKLMLETLSDEFQRAGLPRPTLAEDNVTGHLLRLTSEGGPQPAALKLRDEAGPEDYTLAVGPGGVAVTAGGPAGVSHAVSTLYQLVRANRRENALPCLTIRDWPSFRWRAFQDDLTRGPSSTLDELKREVRLGAGLKMNVFTYYMEYQYAFSKHPLLWPPDGSLTPEELKALVEYAAPLRVDILGNQQSFGHFTHILKHDAYKHLAENRDVISPVAEDTYRLLDDFYSEVIPLLPFGFFNVCCDETWGLGAGPSKPLADQIGIGGVYVRHIRRVHDLVSGKYKKRMMMWGDIILNHPRDLEAIPKDTIMMSWAYDPRPSFEDQIVPFARSGYEFFVCPGVNNWSRILPDFEAATKNIQAFVRDGAKHGALGVLNTAWDDDGETLNAPNWHGLAWGAECSWNASQTDPGQFNRRIGAVMFGERGDHFGRAIELLAVTHRMPGMDRMMNGRFWKLDLGPGAPLSPEQQASADLLLKHARLALKHLEACRKEATLNRELLDAVIFGARRMELIGERIMGHCQATNAYVAASGQAGPQAAAGVRQAEAILRSLRNRHAGLRDEWQTLWGRENRPYALDWTLKRYDAALQAYDQALAGLNAARGAAEAGRPLPPAEKAGLNPPEAGAH